MTLRVPPGRTGRRWLVRRLEIARTGADALKEKRRVLLRRRQQLEPEREQAELEWRQAARTAAELGQRALALSGQRRLRLAAFYVSGHAEANVRWRNLLGVAIPEGAEIDFGEAAELVPLGASVPLTLAAAAHREALAAAARHAHLQEAQRRIDNELVTTARRLRALEKRWIPRHRAALAQLELALDELEREEAGRTRWFRERGSRRRIGS
jgi:V/A-type H+-transporting ATPase subunit D